MIENKRHHTYFSQRNQMQTYEVGDRFLLKSSYCSDNCSDESPCPDCLDMCNTFTISAKNKTQTGYDYFFGGHWANIDGGILLDTPMCYALTSDTGSRGISHIKGVVPCLNKTWIGWYAYHYWETIEYGRNFLYRREAKEQSKKYEYTGIPHNNGHLSKRIIRSPRYYQCSTSYIHDYNNVNHYPKKISRIIPKQYHNASKRLNDKHPEIQPTSHNNRRTTVHNRNVTWTHQKHILTLYKQTIRLSGRICIKFHVDHVITFV